MKVYIVINEDPKYIQSGWIVRIFETLEGAQAFCETYNERTYVRAEEVYK